MTQEVGIGNGDGWVRAPRLALPHGRLRSLRALRWPWHPRWQSPGVLLAFALLVAGCGYTGKPVFPADIHTVAVPIFANRSFDRGVEFELTEAIKKEIETRTPYKVVAPDRADTILNGTIVSVSQSTLSYTRTGGLPQELEKRIVVDMEWKNSRTGQVLRDRKGLTAAAPYVPARPVNENPAVGQHEAVQLLADEIVSAMQGNW